MPSEDIPLKSVFQQASTSRNADPETGPHLGEQAEAERLLMEQRHRDGANGRLGHGRQQRGGADNDEEVDEEKAIER